MLTLPREYHITSMLCGFVELGLCDCQFYNLPGISMFSLLAGTTVVLFKVRNLKKMRNFEQNFSIFLSTCQLEW